MDFIFDFLYQRGMIHIIKSSYSYNDSMPINMMVMTLRKMNIY